MANSPDLLPNADGVGNLGTAGRPWDVAYVNKLRAGGIEVNVNDLATLDSATPTTAVGLPVPHPVADNGKIPVAREGVWVLNSVPDGSLPPVTTANNGMILQVVGGKWTVADNMVLPPVDASMDGAVLRVIGGKFVPVKHGLNPADMPNPVPVAPAEDDQLLISSGGDWTTAPITEKLAVPPISASDVGKFLVVARDGNDQLVLKYSRPPAVTASAPGCIPPLPGDAKQYLNGLGQWGAVTASNNGSHRVGDIKDSLRLPDSQWLACDGKTVGMAGSGANYYGNRYRALYAVLAKQAGISDWETSWSSGTALPLPIMDDCRRIMCLPEAQAPAEASIILQATAGGPTHFQCQLSRNMDFQTITNANSSPDPSGWYRLDGEFPELLSGISNTFADDLSVFLDVTAVYTGLEAGLWHYRARQTFGASISSPNSVGRWRYGSFITAH